MQNWNIKQLKDAMQNDLRKCNTSFERSMVVAICGKEIKDTAEKIAQDRKLTPGEIAIAQEFGFQG